MYLGFYGLHELPFELTPDPRYLFLTPSHREALSSLQYALTASKGLTLLVGEAGTGKTTILRAALQSDTCRGVACVYLNNPTLTRNEFVETLASCFQLGADARVSKAVLLERLPRALADRRKLGETTALVVDEAQCLSGELLEEIRLLANIDTGTLRPLPIILAGQPELQELLERPELRQLKQRVALRCEIELLDLSETAGYIASRIRRAGGVPSQLFTQEAVRAIYEYSRGIPRTVSVICDNALVTGLAADRRPVDLATVLDVCREFRLSLHSGSPGQAVPVRSTPEPEPEIPAGQSVVEAAEPTAQSAAAGMRPRRLFSMFGMR